LRVALDLRWLQQACRNSPDGGLGGIAVFSRNLWIGLAEARPGLDLVAILREGPIPPALAAILARAPGAQVLTVGPRGAFFSEARASRRLMARHIETEWTRMRPLSRLGVDVLHRLDHTPPPRRADFATVVTVYDLIGLTDSTPAGSLRQRLLRRYQHRHFGRISRAAAIAPISEATAGGLRERFPALADRMVVIPPGISNLAGGDALTRSTLLPAPPPGRYFLHVGLLTPRKNPEGLIQALRRYVSAHGRDTALVCVGPYEANDGIRATIEETARRHDVADLVHVLGAVPDVALGQLYCGAEALVFPSFDEGFGLPLVESLACGTPCVASDSAVSREAAGPLAIYVDPCSSDSIAGGMVLAVSREHRSTVKREGPRWSGKYSLEAMAQQYIRLYTTCARAGGAK